MLELFSLTEAEWLAFQSESACPNCLADVNTEEEFCPSCGFIATVEDE